jgi:hypothetical protein
MTGATRYQSQAKNKLKIYDNFERLRCPILTMLYMPPLKPDTLERMGLPRDQHQKTSGQYSTNKRSVGSVLDHVTILQATASKELPESASAFEVLHCM